MLARNLIGDSAGGLPPNTGSLHLCPQSQANVFTAPTTAHLQTVTNAFIFNDAANRLQLATKTAGSRVPQGTIAGRKSTISVPVQVEPKGPGQLTGADTWDITHLMHGLAGGAEVVVNSQSEVVIASIVSAATDGTSMVVNVNTNAADWPTIATYGPFPVAHRSYDAASSHGDHFQVLCTDVTQVGGTGSGGTDLTLKNAPLAYPVAGTDKLQGGGFWPMQDDWSQLFSGVGADGFMGIDFMNAKVNQASFTAGADGVLQIDFDLMIPRGWRNPTAFVLGDASGDTFTAGDLTLRVPNAREFTGARFVNLVKKSTSTRLVTATETKAEIDPDSTSIANGTITFVARGSGAIAASTGLAAITSASEHQAGPYTISSGGYVIVQAARREPVKIALTSGSRTAAQIVTEAVAFLTTNEYYGKVGRDGHVKVDYTTILYDDGGTLKMRSPQISSKNANAGYEAQIAIVDDGDALNMGDTIFQAFFDLVATDHVEIEPWTPGGTESKQPVANWRGKVLYFGYLFEAETLPLTINNGGVGVPVKDGTQFDKMVVAAPSRASSVAISQPFWAWLQSIYELVDSNTGGVMNVNIGDAKGYTIGLHVMDGVPGGPTQDDGTPRKLSYTIECTDPGSGLPETVLGHS